MDDPAADDLDEGSPHDDDDPHDDGGLVADGRMVAPLEVATTRRARSRGLLGRDGIDGALWLPGVRSVHTFGMRFAIDVAWIARDGQVLRTVTMPPGRISRWVPRAAGVLEAEAGRLTAWGIPGASVAVPYGRGRTHGAP